MRRRFPRRTERKRGALFLEGRFNPLRRACARAPLCKTSRETMGGLLCVCMCVMCTQGGQKLAAAAAAASYIFVPCLVCVDYVNAQSFDASRVYVTFRTW